MAQLICTSRSKPEQRYLIRKRMTTIGTEPNHDFSVVSESQGLVATLLKSEDGFQILPGSAKIRHNGAAISRTTTLNSCDRIDWAGGSAVFLSSEMPIQPAALEAGNRSLSVLQNIASTLQSSGSISSALHQTLEALVEMSGAESGYLLSEMAGSGWELTASRESPDDASSSRPKRKELFSNTILQEALKKREPVYVENMIGHPWSEAASVIEARIFSAACFPLIVGETIFGAVFLMTRSAGKSIKRESLIELSLLATQAALLMGSQARLQSAQKENARLRNLVGTVPTGFIAGNSPIMAEILRKVQKLAPTPLSILILGETGTGKEMIAQEIHRQSLRSKGPFLAVNCAAIPGTLLEATLFGHERGAFTGAFKSQPGKFLQAEGGTLFLDEIGDLPLELQAKLLRVLQERQVEPLGGKPVSIDIRVLAATHQDLDAAVRAGRFRQDLFFRLNGASLKLPALRERSEDISLLAESFLKATGTGVKISPEGTAALERHSWSGNIRELQQVVTRAALLCEGQMISAQDFELDSSGAVARDWAESSEFSSLQEAQLAFTREYVEKILSRFEGNRARAASNLGVSERTLYRILSTDSPGRLS